MPEKNLIHVWKETLSSKPVTRETLNGMHLTALHQATQQKLDEYLLYIRFEIHDFILCELKGRPKELTGFELPQKEEEILWLFIQLHGRLSFPTGDVSQSETIFSFTSDGSNLLTVAAEKQWVLLLGIAGASRQQLLSEQPVLRKQYEQRNNHFTPAIPISYANRQVLEQFSKIAFGPFTTVHHIGLLLGKLYASYVQQLDKQGVQGKEEGLIQLYHQAINYITDNYMDAELNRLTISAALNCSTRSLSRAFEGRSINLNSSIMMMRLHKSRELLRDRPELTIEHIAGMLHFPNAKHFATQYKKCFHRTPREERKTLAKST